MDGTPFDIFLSYNSRDRAAVERIAFLLRQEGFVPWFDASDLVAGGDWQDGIELGLRHAKGCAVFLGPHGFGDWQIQEMKVAASMAAKDPSFRYFLVLLPGAPEPLDSKSLPAFITLRSRINLREGFASPRLLKPLIDAIHGRASGPPIPVPLPGSPYRGLEAFDAEHAEFFFGRDAEIRKLLDKLRDAPFLAVIGPSGSGKSSLVLAGLIPALRGGRLEGSAEWPIVTMVPGAHPVESLAVALDALDPGPSRNRLLEELQESSRALRLEASALLRERPRSARLVLVVDQFEEIFTLCRDAEERDRFLALLLAAAEPAGRCLVIITMRADFYPRITEYPALAEQVANQQLLVGALSKEGLTAAIEQPAFRKGVQFEPGLVSTILADVGSDAGALPLLQYALDELWKRQQGHLLTLEGYRASGGVGEAIATRANTVFEGLTPDQQAVARRVLLRLTQPGEATEDTRRRAELDELVTRPAERPAIEAAVNALVVARLLTASKDEVSGAAQVDVAHEALIRAWPRLRTWLDEDRQGLLVHRRLTEAAQEWARTARDADLLYRGARLSEALGLAARQPDALNEQEREFLAESEALRARERAAAIAAAEARERLRRRILTGLGAFSAVALLLALLAGWQWREAGRQAAEAMLQTGIAEQQTSAARAAEGEAQRQAAAASNAEATAQAEAARAESEAARAEREAEVARTAEDEAQRQAAAATTAENAAQAQAQVALSRQLAAQSGLNLDNPGLGMLLAAEAYALNADDVDVRRSLFAAATAQPALQGLLHGQAGNMYSLAFSPDGTLLASGSENGSVVLWDSVTRQMAKPPIAGFTDVWRLVFSPDGRLLAFGTLDSTIQVWDVASWQALAPPIVSERGMLSALAFSPDGTMLASANYEGAIELWSVADGQPVGAPFSGHEGTISGLAFTPNGDALISGGNDDSTIRIWDLVGMRQVGEPIETNQAGISRLALSPDGATLYTAGNDGTLQRWNLNTREKVGGTISGDGSQLMALSLSRDGTTLAAGSFDGRLWSWDVSGDDLIRQQIASGQGPILSMAVNDDGSLLASGGLDPPIALWRIASPRPRLFAALNGMQGDTSQLVYSPDGATIATGSFQGEVILWDAATGAQLGPPLQGVAETDSASPSQAMTLDFSPDGSLLATGRGDGEFYLWDIATRSQVWLHETRLDGEPILDLEFSPNGTWLAVAGGDGAVRLWRPDDPAFDEVLYQDSNISRAVAFNPAGTILAAPGTEGSVRFWDVATRQPVGKVIETGQGDVPTIAFVRDDDTIATGGANGAVRYWSVPAGEPLQTVDVNGENGILKLATTDDGSRVASVSGVGVITTWLASEADPVVKEVTKINTVDALAFSPDGERLAFFDSTDRFERVVAEWAVEAEAIVTSFPVYSTFLDAILSADGRLLAASSTTGAFTVWDTESGSVIFTNQMPYVDGIWRLALTADGRRLATSTGQGRIQIWDLLTGQPVGSLLEDQGNLIAALSFNADGTLLASGDVTRRIVVWDLVTGLPAVEPFTFADQTPDEDGSIGWLAFSPAVEDQILAFSSGFSVALWEIGESDLIREPFQKINAVFSRIAFREDGELLAYTDGLGGVDIWNLETEQFVGEPLAGEDGSGNGLGFNPDGTLIAKGSVGGGVQIWEVSSSSLMASLGLSDQPVVSVAFTADGREVVAADVRGTVGRWPVTPPEWLARACTVANRNLTLEEWQGFIGDPADPLRPYHKTCADLPGPSDAASGTPVAGGASATPVASGAAA